MKKPLHSFIPKRLKIAGKRVNIEAISKAEAEGEEESQWGEFQADEALIRICWETSPEYVLDTLLHEILHACYYYWNMQETDGEERTVHTMASALQGLFTDNAHLLVCVQKYTKAIRED